MRDRPGSLPAGISPRCLLLPPCSVPSGWADRCAVFPLLSPPLPAVGPLTPNAEGWEVRLACPVDSKGEAS